jgi:hypothetical protein
MLIAKAATSAISAGTAIANDAISTSGGSRENIGSEIVDISEIRADLFAANFGVRDAASVYFLARDILQNPQKNKGFGLGLGKKKALKELREGLASIDQAIENCGPDDNQSRANLEKMRQAIAAGANVTRRKLNAARAKKTLEVGGAVAATTAAVAFGVATFGVGAPVTVLTALSTGGAIASTVISDLQLMAKLAKGLSGSEPTGGEGINIAPRTRFSGAYATANVSTSKS